MFEFLFKFPPEQWRRGLVEIAVSWEVFAMMTIVIVIAVAWLLDYAGVPTRPGAAGWRKRAGLVALRSALLTLVTFSLLSPQLVVPIETPARGRVAVLIDDSLSMRIADQDGRSRADYALSAFAPGTGTLGQRLEARFETEYFRFAGDTAPLHSGSELGFTGPGTDLAGALRRTSLALSGVPLAAVVVVTDGGDDGTEALAEAVAGLRPVGVPVHAVGVGSQRFARDLEISAVRVPQDVFVDDTLEAQVSIQHRGMEGRSVRLVVEDNSLIVAEQELVLPRGRDRVTARVELGLKEAGPHRLRFRLPVMSDEAVIDNNEERVVVDAKGGRIDVLHLEGEPRFEVKFTRRALTDDKNIQLISLVRTSDNKLYRLGVEKPEDLADGFPTTAETLFPFRVVVLGSVEASRLTPDQQQLLVEFVARRGGGLLLLGGRRAFAEGGYGDSPLAALMPVVLEPRAAAFRAEVKIAPTRIGSRHAVLRTLGAEVWPRLPPLSVINPIRRVKPGATLLLEGRGRDDDPLVVLASHRYGRGTVAVLPVRNTWRWQMHSQIPLDDLTHETLWRQLLRWLARPASGRVRVELAPRQGVLGQPVLVAADVVDASFRPLAGATVRLTIHSPIGDRTVRELDWRPSRQGRYETRFTPTESGVYDLEASLVEADRAVATATAHVHVSATGREYHQAELDAPLLQRLADETGGRYYTPARASDLIDAIAQPGSGRMVITRLPLWDMPALYLLLVLFAALEWYCRRRWGMR